MNHIVAVTGCFDVPHAGHVRLLNYATTSFGLRVWMGINSDRAIRALKGESRPVYPEADRVLIWSSFRGVSRVIVVDSLDMADFLTTYKPEYWVKGSDYSLETLKLQERAAAEAVGCQIVFFPRTGPSTSDTIRKLVTNHGRD